MKINITNYEAYFLLYIDNELSIQDRMEVELFVKENPIHQKELIDLQKTILSPTEIVFEDKALLYRFEEMEAALPNAFKKSLYRKETPIVKGFFTTKRILSLSSVAAILMLIIGYIALHDTDTVKTNTPLANFNSTKEQTKENLATVAINKGMDKLGLAIHKTAAINNQKIKTEANNTNTSFMIDYTRLENNNNEIVSNNIPAISSNNTAIPVIEEVNNSTQPSIISNETKLADAAETFTNIDTEEQDRSIYIANFEIDSDKLRGITRRVNAFLRRNKTDKEK